MRELQACLKNTSVVVEMDNSRSLNMDRILSDVKAHYEEIAAQSREETEYWYRTKVTKTLFFLLGFTGKYIYAF